MAGRGDAQMDKIIAGIAGSPGTPNISMVMNQVMQILRENINGSDIPGGVKGAISGSVSGQVLSPYDAVVTVPEYRRDSVYEGQSANLVMVFNQRKAYRKPPPMYPIEDGVWVRMSGGMIKPYSNMFLEKTLAQANAIHPLVTVTMS